MQILVKTLTGKTITLEVESSDTMDKTATPEVAGSSSTDIEGSELLVGSCSTDSCAELGSCTSETFPSAIILPGATLDNIQHGSTAFGMKSAAGVVGVVLVADGKGGSANNIDKTRIYGRIGAVMCGTFTDFHRVDRNLNQLRKRLLRNGTEATVEEFANNAYNTLLTCPFREVESAKVTIVFGAVENDIPVIWIATREGAYQFHGDYIGEGSGGYLVEMFLAENNYTSAWAIQDSIMIAKRAVVAALEDPHTGGIIRVMCITGRGAEVLEKVSADELKILEEERTAQIVDGEQ